MAGIGIAALLVGIPANAQSGAAAAAGRDRIVVGASVGVVPGYQGSDAMRVLPLPAIDIRQGWFIANMFNGIGVAFEPQKNVTVTGGVTFVQGYRKRDAPAGIDSLADAAGARVTVSIRERGLVATLGMTRSLGVTDGTLADASLAYPIRAGNRLFVIPSASISWADRRYTDRYFGISAAEAIQSGLPRYRANGGIRDIGAGITANYRLSPRWGLTGSVRGTRLVGDAADSPLVRRRTNVAAFAAITYRFGRMPRSR
ncbi:MipA/OmpV family protein [Sphingomonas pokkalii]|uniref:MipA/OmpV family protein n=1 Tax=Sphingomonas pokkalii TaxID=2175090 RepID=UPI001402FA3F|nr:MipA/OmpV family protein [Sphingomonas pokkalii]